MSTIRSALLSAVAFAGVALAAPAALGYVQITSPTRNIDCIIGTANGGYASCLAEKTAWKRYPKRPAACDVEWVRSEITLARRRVLLGGCRGDIGPQCVRGQVAPCRVLAYGRSVTLGGIRCTSTTAAMVCRRTTGATRPGFKIARQGYTVLR